MGLPWYVTLWNKVKWVFLIVLAVLLVALTAGSWETILQRLGLNPLPDVTDPTPVPPPVHEEATDHVEQTKKEVEESNDEVEDMSDDELIADIDGKYGPGSDTQGS